MFVVTEEDEAAIRAVYQQRGEFAAAVELRRRFPGITDNAQARECAAPYFPMRKTLLRTDFWDEGQRHDITPKHATRTH